MVNRTRNYRKKIWISDEERDRAHRIRIKLGISDADIYQRGLDNLVEEEFQGQAGSMTEAERARRFHSISLEEWNALSEKEKNEYIANLPPKKTKWGERANKDWQDLGISKGYADELRQHAQDRADFFSNEMKLITDRLEAKRKKYAEDRRG